jgi:hypothetical protein
MAVPQLLAKLHEELIEAHGEIENFSSFLRVCCGRYLTLQLAGDMPRDPARPDPRLRRRGHSAPRACARRTAAGRSALERAALAEPKTHLLLSFPRKRESRLGERCALCRWIPAFAGMTLRAVPPNRVVG